MTDQGLSFGPDYIMMQTPGALEPYVIMTHWPLDKAVPDGWVRCYMVEVAQMPDRPITDAPVSTREQKRTEWLAEQHDRPRDPGPDPRPRVIHAGGSTGSEYLTQQREARIRAAQAQVEREARTRASKPSGEVVFGSSIVAEGDPVLAALLAEEEEIERRGEEERAALRRSGAKVMATREEAERAARAKGVAETIDYFTGQEAEASAELAGARPDIGEDVEAFDQTQSVPDADAAYNRITAGPWPPADALPSEAEQDLLEQWGMRHGGEGKLNDYERALIRDHEEEAYAAIHEEIEREGLEDEAADDWGHEFDEFPPGHVLETQWEEDHTEGYNEEVGEIEFGIVGEDDLPEDEFIPKVKWPSHDPRAWEGIKGDPTQPPFEGDEETEEFPDPPLHHNNEDGQDDYRPTPKLKRLLNEDTVLDGSISANEPPPEEDWDVFKDHREPTELPSYGWAKSESLTDGEKQMIREIFEDLAVPGLRGTKFSREDASKITPADWDRARMMVRALFMDSKHDREAKGREQKRVAEAMKKIHGAYTDLGKIAFKLSEVAHELDPEDMGSIERQLDETISIP